MAEGDYEKHQDGRRNGGVLSQRGSSVNEWLDSQHHIAHHSAEYSGKDYDQLINADSFN